MKNRITPYYFPLKGPQEIWHERGLRGLPGAHTWSDGATIPNKLFMWLPGLQEGIFEQLFAKHF